MKQQQILDISGETILKIALAGLFFYTLYLVRDVVIWFFFALIVSVMFEPLIGFLKMLRVPRILAVIFVYVSFFSILGLVIYITAPFFINEIKEFSQSVPQYFERISPLFKELKIEALQNLESFTQNIMGSFEQISVSVFNALVTFFGGIASAIFIISVSFFLSLEERGVEQVLRLLTPKRNEEYVFALFKRCQKKVSGWFGSRILACLFVGLASLAIFYIFEVKYALILALIAGVFNFVPFLGPAITGILLIIFIGVSDSWLKALLILAIFAAIQEFENKILSPILIKKFIGLPPVLVLLALVIGGKLFGFLGAIFAVPVFGILYEFTKEFLEKKKEEEEQNLD